MTAQGRAGDDGAGKELEDEAAGPAVRDEGVGARILRHDDLAARLLPLPLPQPPYASRQGDGPEKFKEPATRMMGSPVPPGAAPDT